MAEKRRRKRKIFSGIILALLLAIGGFVIWFQVVKYISPPEITDADKGMIGLKVENPEENFYTCGNNWLKRSNSSLWEMYVQGKPFERGLINGKLSRNLIYTQEEAFVAQLNQIVPSRFYQFFLRNFIYWFNRDLDKYIPKEYKLEVYGISLSASRKYTFIGSNYQRLLNYHSAHDIGHALQNLHLVGCTSFGVWDSKSKDGKLLIGRNFDFYAGDDFAENKIVCFERPDKGYAFMMITWGGMIGAVSGMNEKGLTITINSAKSEIPLSARMPVSILAREILQYAKTIEAAYAIAKSHETFVSESFLIGSAEQNRAAIIEKSPSHIELYDPQRDYIVCTNHFQSAFFWNQPGMAIDRNENASLYRYRRVVQDITNEQPFNVKGMARVLRDQEGLNGKQIGMGNEKAINQFIAHHSVIFKPDELLVWVSTRNWQLGPYVCYDLRKIFHNFAGLKEKREIIEEDRSIAPDPFFVSEGYQKFRSFREMKQFILNVNGSKEQVLLPATLFPEFIATNPEFYQVYDITGDYYRTTGQCDSSIRYYRKALSKEIPLQAEKDEIIGKLGSCLSKQK